ncbi:P-loop NTPase fold protein [Ignatzschineria sp. LJL83]
MSKHITKVLTDFLTNSENNNKILVLKGKWGVGKTYFWENFIKENKDIIAKTMPAYSYVSLFGVQNSLELKEKITRNLISFTGEYSQLIEETTKTNIGGVLTAVSKIGWVKRQVGDLSNFLQDALIRNQVICFDDIERIDSKFPIETLMGYADELAQQKTVKLF